MFKLNSLILQQIKRKGDFVNISMKTNVLTSSLIRNPVKLPPIWTFFKPSFKKVIWNDTG